MASQLNHQKLVEIQANLDTSGLDKMGADHPIFREYKNLDLTSHTMVYDGGLTMKLGDTKRVKALHVLLLEDCMMLLQKQVNFASSIYSGEDRRNISIYHFYPNKNSKSVGKKCTIFPPTKSFWNLHRRCTLVATVNFNDPVLSNLDTGWIKEHPPKNYQGVNIYR